MQPGLRGAWEEAVWRLFGDCLEAGRRLAGAWEEAGWRLGGGWVEAGWRLGGGWVDGGVCSLNGQGGITANHNSSYTEVLAQPACVCVCVSGYCCSITVSERASKRGW